MCSFKPVIHHNTLCQHFLQNSTEDCWWFSELIMEIVASWEGISAWMVFSTGHLMSLFSCGGEDSHIHHTQIAIQSKTAKGSIGCPQDIPATMSTFPDIFRLPSCWSSWPLTLFRLHLLHWSERTDNFSKNHTFSVCTTKFLGWLCCKPIWCHQLS